MRNTCFILLLFILKAITVFSSHIVGGDMYYDYLGSNNYRVTIVIYRDCASSGAAYDNPLSLGIFNSSNQLIREVQVPFPGSSVLPVVLNNPCVKTPSGICTERAIYTTILNLPPTSGGYILSYQRCCRGQNVTNLNSPENTGLTLTTRITGTNALVNSSPRFTNYPPLVICNNDILNFNHSATDPDGDELTYELITPYAGASDASPAPSPPPPPPYFPVSFRNGFYNLNPLGPGATISINPTTGQLTADPQALGLMVVGIRVKEFRNGVQIGQSDRDFLFKVLNCTIQMEAIIPTQIESSYFKSYCQGFTIPFDNNSYGGTSYKWDFGVTNTTSDVSNLYKPTYTFPGPGIYEVSLVVNPGWPCTDTVKQTYKLLDSISLKFDVEDSVCITGNALDFTGHYFGPPNPTFVWDFSQHASITTSNSLIVNNVTFTKGGFTPVTFKTTIDECEQEYTDSVFIYMEPEINFGITPLLKCAPYFAQFIDSSKSNAPLIYTWDLDDGATSTNKNPSHIYNDPGEYDIKLTIQANEGCLTTQTLTKTALVKVYPSPTADFTISPDEQSAFSPFFSIQDLSIDGKDVRYFYHDSIYILERNPDFSIVESGNHVIYQIATNQFGCKDTTTKTVYVIPVSTVYIPNTFTPDNDEYNNTLTPIAYDILEFKFSIYNRWGEKVFDTSELLKGWDGRFKGSQCPPGIYLYKIEYKQLKDQKTIEKTGHINLLR